MVIVRPHMRHKNAKALASACEVTFSEMKLMGGGVWSSVAGGASSAKADVGYAGLGTKTITGTDSGAAWRRGAVAMG